MAFENIVGKGENAVNLHFLLFPQSFLPFQTHKILILICHLQMLSICSSLENRRLVKG